MLIPASRHACGVVIEKVPGEIINSSAYKMLVKIQWRRVEDLLGVFPAERLTKLGLRRSASLVVHWSPRTKKTDTRRGTSGAAAKQEDSDDQNSHHDVDLMIL
jgi:hypothetical protein